MLFVTLRDRMYPTFYLCLLCESHGLVVSSRSFLGFFWRSFVPLGSARPRLGSFCLSLMLLSRLAPVSGALDLFCVHLASRCDHCLVLCCHPLGHHCNHVSCSDGLPVSRDGVIGTVGRAPPFGTYGNNRPGSNRRSSLRRQTGVNVGRFLGLSLIHI